MTISPLLRAYSSLQMLGIWNELFEIDFSVPNIHAKNAKVDIRDAHYLEEEECWTIDQNEGFFKISSNIRKEDGRRYFLSITHANPLLHWEEEPQIKIWVNGETASTLIPPRDSYQTELLDITDLIRNGKNTIFLEGLNILPMKNSRYQIKEIHLVDRNLS